MKIAALLFAFLLALALVPSAAAQSRGANFEQVDCATFKLSDSVFECGYVNVPEIHSQPGPKTLKLGVAVLPSTGDTPTQDAFVVAQGGPGGSTIATFATFFQNDFYPAIATLRSTRDVILYDQRGTLYAQPSLQCPEELDLTIATIEQDLSDKESERQYEQAALKCRERLINAGVNLAAYNSIENALDLQDIRAALDYDKFDLYGVSYGTLLALHALREEPTIFRSVVLDAVVPTQINPNSAIAESQNRVFEQLFTVCAADENCNRTFPNLKQIFYAQVDALNANPVRVPITDSETGKTYNAVLNGDTLMNILFQFIYNTELVPALPQMIYDARDRRYTLIEAFYPIVLFDRTFASGMYYSVMCAEDADFTIADLDLQGVDPHIAKAQTRDTTAFLQLCQKWDVPQLGSRADEPVTANVPTLVLSGDFDPITPPPFGQAAAATIIPSYIYEFPAYGHGALTSGNCPNEIIAAFVRDPAHVPNAQCIETDASQVTFITPANTILVPGIGKLQLAMLQANLQAFLVPIVLLGLLLTVWLVAPILWLIRRSQKRAGATRFLPRFAPWFAALASVLALSFFILLFALLVIVSLQNGNTIQLVLGAPRQWLIVYLIPLLFTLLALIFTVGILQGWQNKNWGTLQRVYYSFLALAGVGLVLWFAINGVLFAVFS